MIDIEKSKFNIADMLLIPLIMSQFLILIMKTKDMDALHVEVIKLIQVYNYTCTVAVHGQSSNNVTN